MQDDIRALFDLPGDHAYFNCASIGPLPLSAKAEIEASAARHTRPWTVTEQQWIGDAEQRRALFAAIAGVEADSIALVPAASYGFAVAARNLAAGTGQAVLVLAEDFPSGIYTWRSFAERTGCAIRTVARAPGRSWTEAVLEALDDRIAIVSVPTVHWTDGALVDLETVAARAREVGAALVVDASQSFGVMSLDLAAIRPDFLIAVGYKWLLGPYGLSYLYVAGERRGGVPLEENWLQRLGSEDFAALVDYQDRYRPGARRFDVGQRSAFELTNAASASLRLLAGWGAAAISERLGAVTERIEAAARELGLGTTSGPARCPHIIGLGLPAGAADVFREENVHVGFRGRAARISPHMYTSEGDVARLLGALARIAASAQATA
jgi:selenocysteine lyase/cysteine desulfurase